MDQHDNILYTIASININTISAQNKINALQTFARLLDLDIILLQEVDNEQLEISGFNIIFNVDESRRGTAIAIRDQIKFTNIEKSLDSRLICVRINGNITICNIYAPSGTQQRGYRENFFNCTLAYYLRSLTDFLIIGGDFNSVISSKDSTGNSNHSPAFKAAAQNLQLLDSWEVLHQNRIEYTYIRPGIGARLDRIYVSRNLKQNVRDAKIYANCFSDHKSYVTVVSLPNLGVRYGYGSWRLKNNILNDDEAMADFPAKWQYWSRQKRNFSSWYEWWMDFAKPKVVSYFKWKTKLVYKEFRDTMEFMYSNLKKLYDDYMINPAKRIDLHKIKSKMLCLQRNFSQKTTNWSETHIQGESLSVFQLGEQTKFRSKTRIRQLQIGESSSEDPAVISDAVTSYFRNLFSVTPTLPNTTFIPQRTIPDNNGPNQQLTSNNIRRDFCKPKKKCRKKITWPRRSSKRVLYTFLACN
jgi:exonuclease III